jgi:hypothetical protein
MVFQDGDSGPFWLSEDDRVAKRAPQPTGERKWRDKLIDELVEELGVIPGVRLSRRPRKKDLQQMAIRNGVDLKVEFEVTKPGWMNQPKGLQQVLWERGWIDESNLVSYKAAFQENNQFSLQWLMSQCPDFAQEKSAMEALLHRISSDAFNVSILVTPKYHCELAGEGIEYSWGLAKRHFRNLPLLDKKGRVNFIDSVRMCVEYVKVNHVRQFAAKTRRYMLTYGFCAQIPGIEIKSGGETLPYSVIEKHVKKEFKTHRSVENLESGYIAAIYRSSIKAVMP